MRKKMMMLLGALVMTVAAHAQFEEGKYYVNTSLTGLNLSYSGSDDLHLGVEAKGGYLFADNLMALANFGIDADKVDTRLKTGLGVRYYFVDNGIYAGVNAKYVHAEHFDDLMPGVEVGYAFFLNRYLTIEPAVYYDQSIKKHSDYSTFGVKVGFGFYF